MKKIKTLFFVIVLMVSAIVIKAQTPQEYYSPDRLFDTTIFDNYGNRYTLNDIRVDTLSENGSGYKTTLAACSSTNAGYFDLYLQPGCGFEPVPGNPTQSAIHAQRLTVLCQLFQDLSNFITNRGGNSNKVRVYIKDFATMVSFPSTSSVAGMGGGYFTIPSSTKGGIVDSEIWKTINSGQDSYIGVTSPLVSSSISFYHAQIGFNFYNTSINWHDDLTTAPTSTLIDIYTIGLHEMGHALGFASLLNHTGGSYTSFSGGNYFSRYDLNLRTQSGLNVITNSGGCSMYSYSINPSFSNPTNTLSPGSSTCGTLPYTTSSDVTTCSTSITYSNSSQIVNVYTPNCFEAGSSLSHFEDMCYPTNTPTNNNTYFVMSNVNGFGQMKRYLKEEERKVLCDIGYTVAATYGTSTYTTTQKTYTAGSCTGLSVIGINDGFTGGNYTYTATVGSVSGPIAPLTNDIGVSGGSFECLEVVVGSGTVSGTSGTTFSYTPTSSGLHLLRYLPKNGTVIGNITYIYFKASPNGTACSTPNGCEMVYNGSFENASTTCGGSWLSPTNGPFMDCWSLISGFYKYCIRNCSTSSAINGFSPSNYTIPHYGVDTWNGSPNNAFTYLTNYGNIGVNNNILQGMVTTSLVPTSQYKISFWVNPSAGPGINNLVLSLATSTAPVVGPVPPSTVIPSPYTALGTFTVVPDGNWHNCSALITFTGTIASKHISIIPQWSNSRSASVASGFFLDDISILPASSASTFTLPTISCTGTSYTLNPMVSVPNGTFTGPGVSLSGSDYIFTANSAGTGFHTLAYTYTTPSGCTLTAVAQTSVVTQPTAITVFANPPAGLCPSYSTATLTANGATSYSWNPGALTGSTVSVSPSITTTYTVVGANATCSLSTTIAINVSTVCACTATNVLPTTLSSTVMNAPSYALNAGLTITSGSVNFNTTEVQCSPNVSITVASGATLNINQSHFYSCFDMWQGITVQNGGYLIIGGSLIEDANQAVIVDNNTSTTGKVLDISGSIFNKNFVSITVSNFTQTAFPFTIKSSVFTSRDFTFTPTVWPSHTAITTTCSPANPLGTPFCLGNFPVMMLKAPNNTNYSYYGVTLNNVGTTINPSLTPTYYSIQIGDPTNAANANIFDNLMYGISATNSNLKVSYNVFQNTQSKQIHGNWLGGIAVESNSDDTYNNYLMVKSTSPYTTSRINKFYDCTYSVKTNNIFEHDIQRNISRSTQSASATYQQGKYGFFVTTNRYKKCDIASNIFANIENGITFYTTYGAITFGTSSYTNTQYAMQANINSNTLAPVPSGSVGTEFVSNAITTENVLSAGSTQTVAANLSIFIQSNVMQRVYRGISSSNFSTPPVLIQSNTASISIDPGGNLQNGISITACTNPSVQLNSILGQNQTNTITTGIYASMNTAPKVTCNTVSTTYQGFEFAGSQAGTKWKGNSMTTHTLGLALTYTGVIGAQGSTNNPIDNAWNGSWTGTNYHTWTFNSVQNSSTLYVQNTAVYSPTNNSGSFIPDSYAAGGVSLTTGAYSCAGGGARLITNDPDYEQAYLKTLENIAGYQVTKNSVVDPSNYIAQYQLYKNIDSDPSSYLTSKSLSDFYSDNRNAAYGKLLDGQNHLINGNYGSAISALSSISSKNNIENNYNDFYNLYSKYYTKAFLDIDNKALNTLANKCPFVEGEVVYQARALYNIINSTVEIFKDNCPDNTSFRLYNNKGLISNWDVNIYPNPASNELFISTNNDKEDIKVIITDVNGRTVGDYNVKTNGFNGNIKLNMNSGIYFVTLSNNNDKVIKKLVITK